LPGDGGASTFRQVTEFGQRIRAGDPMCGPSFDSHQDGEFGLFYRPSLSIIQKDPSSGVSQPPNWYSSKRSSVIPQSIRLDSALRDILANAAHSHET